MKYGIVEKKAHSLSHLHVDDSGHSSYLAVRIGVRSPKDQKSSASVSLQTIIRGILIVTFLLGGFLSASGFYTWSLTSGEPYDSLASIGTGVILGWSTYNSLVHPSISIGIAPFINNSQTSDIIFDISGTINTNRTFTFGLISPFLISSVGFLRGNWTYQNVGDLGSIIYYKIQLDSSLRGGILDGNAVFFYRNLPARVGHGSYTIAIPFGAGLTPQFQSAANLTQFPSYATGQNFVFYLDIPLTFTVISSYPPFSPSLPSPIPELGPKCCGIQGGLQALPYVLDGTSGLFVRYENSTEVDGFQASQNWEFLYLGVGIPLLLSSTLEFARYQSRKDQDQH